MKLSEKCGSRPQRADRCGVTAKTKLAAGLPAVLGDRVQLQQVILNLIVNAIDAMISISDRPRTLLIKSAKDAEGVLIRVQHSGKGLDPENSDRMLSLTLPPSLRVSE